ncbi:hypothetical protein D3C73_1239650 [compost metagenome]
MRHLHARQVAQQDAVRVQRALGLARGARRVDDHGRIVGGRVHRGVVVRLLGQGRVKRHGAFLAVAVDAIHDLQVRQAGAYLAQFSAPFRVRHQRHRAAVGQAELDGVHAKQREQRYRHRAHLVDSNMGDRGFGRLRQVHGHAVAACYAMARQAMRQAVGLRLDVVE